MEQYDFKHFVTNYHITVLCYHELGHISKCAFFYITKIFHGSSTPASFVWKRFLYCFYKYFFKELNSRKQKWEILLWLLQFIEKFIKTSFNIEIILSFVAMPFFWMSIWSESASEYILLTIHDDEKKYSITLGDYTFKQFKVKLSPTKLKSHQLKYTINRIGPNHCRWMMFQRSHKQFVQNF